VWTTEDSAARCGLPGCGRPPSRPRLRAPKEAPVRSAMPGVGPASFSGGSGPWRLNVASTGTGPRGSLVSSTGMLVCGQQVAE
jgi:hypothetical protein